MRTIDSLRSLVRFFGLTLKNIFACVTTGLKGRPISLLGEWRDYCSSGTMQLVTHGGERTGRDTLALRHSHRFSLGHDICNQWLARSTELISRMLTGDDYRNLPRFGDLYADDPLAARGESRFC